MADLRNGSGVYQTYNNAGAGVAELGDNKTAGKSLGTAGRTIFAKVAKSNLTAAELDTIRLALQNGGEYSGVTNDAFSIAGITSDGGDTGGPASDGANSNAFVSGESDVVWIVLQGTGTLNADASNALGVTGAALTVEAVFGDVADEPDTAINVAGQQSGNF